MSENLYQRLSVSKNSTQEEIERAYLALVKKYLKAPNLADKSF